MSVLFVNIVYSDALFSGIKTIIDPFATYSIIDIGIDNSITPAGNFFFLLKKIK